MDYRDEKIGRRGLLAAAGSLAIWDSSAKGSADTGETPQSLPALARSIDRLRSPTGGQMVGFAQSGMGALARDTQEELRETVKITQFTGVNDTAMVNAALATHAGRTIHVPKRSTPYSITSKIVIPTNTTLALEPGAAFDLDYNGDAFELRQGAFIRNLNLEGKGATYTSGRGVVVDGTNGQNGLIEPRINDTAGPCIEFLTTGAGSGFFCVNADLNRTGSAGLDSTLPVIVIADGALAGSAVPRTFVGTRTNGCATVSLGGCNDCFFTGGSYHGPFYFSIYSRGVKLTGIRWGNQTTCDVKGANISITGCGIAPALTLPAGSGGSGQSITIVGNDMINPRIIDNSGFPSTNVIQHSIVQDTSITLRGDSTSVTVSRGNNRNGVFREGIDYCLNIDMQGSWIGGMALPTGFGSAASINIDVPADYMPTYEQFVGPINMTYNGGQKAVFGRLFGTTTRAGYYIRLGYFDATGGFVNYTAATLNAGSGVTRLRGTFRWNR